MAKYLSHIDLNKNELQNAVIHPLGSEPTNPVEGQIYYNSSAGDKQLYYYNGTSFSAVGGVVSLSEGDGISLSGSTNVTISVNASASFFEFVTGALSIKAGSIGATELAATTVTAGSYGSASAIPTFTVDADGRLTAAGSVGISLDKTLDIAADTGTDDGVLLGTDTLTIAGGTNINTSVSGDTITVNLDDSISLAGDLTVVGNLTVSGATQTKLSETVLIEDNIITLNSNETGGPTQNAGIEVERGTAANVAIRWNETTDNWEYTKDGTSYNTFFSNFDFKVGSQYINISSFEQIEIIQGNGMSISGSEGPNEITIAHASTSNVPDVNNSGLTVIQDLTFDTFGHTQTVGSVDITSNVDARITAREYAATISDTATVTHNLVSRDVIVQLYDTVTFETVFADVERTTTNAVDVTFASTPTNDVRVLISKIG